MRKGTVHRDAKNFPGAGNYSIPSRLEEGPKYGMAMKLSNDVSGSAKKNPGPG